MKIKAHPTLASWWGPKVNAQFHQHIFCARLDFAVDDPNGGQGLVVSEAVTFVPVERAPRGDGCVAAGGLQSLWQWLGYTETDLTTEKMAQRITNAETARVWKIKNPARPSAITGRAIAYKLVPAANPHLMARSRSLVTRRGAFANRNLWVILHRDEEKWPAGAYTVQSSGGDGLPTWTAENREVGPGHDPVIWHSFGLTHIPRPEDFPVMPYESVGFTLKPVGFFDSNPAVVLPHGANTASKLAFAHYACCNGGPEQEIPLDDGGKRPSLDHFLGVKSKKVERGFEFRSDFDFHKPPVASGQPRSNGSILSNGVH
ncbi:hypothetical protein WJX74_004226 [Apatococcus lobatus]|uniref:Amine oxidase n=1 Tax=Apatococcus lobatus TaxID=904363 RepID=A0AAW1QLL8_9CHLO